MRYDKKLYFVEQINIKWALNNLIGLFLNLFVWSISLTEVFYFYKIKSIICLDKSYLIQQGINNGKINFGKIDFHSHMKIITIFLNIKLYNFYII